MSLRFVFSSRKWRGHSNVTLVFLVHCKNVEETLLIFRCLASISYCDALKYRIIFFQAHTIQFNNSFHFYDGSSTRCCPPLCLHLPSWNWFVETNRSFFFQQTDAALLGITGFGWITFKFMVIDRYFCRQWVNLILFAA